MEQGEERENSFASFILNHYILVGMKIYLGDKGILNISDRIQLFKVQPKP